jgi:cell fate regulator YaaT (PSP1 superfamily)
MTAETGFCSSSAGRAAPPFGLVEVNPFDSLVCLIPSGMALSPGELVVIQDDEGEEMGRFVARTDAEESESRVVRAATAEDLQLRRELRAQEAAALGLFRRVARELGLNVRAIYAHWRHDRRRILFYFVSEERLDFRSLHRSLAAALNARVTVRQIGVRDHARMLGGLGICGRELCCRAFLREMRPITLRMARQQSLFVEPNKISGVCGKLLCCLGYEDETYRQLIMEMPSIGSRVSTERGEGVVTAVDVLTRHLRVRYGDEAELMVALEDVRLGSGAAAEGTGSEQRRNG